MDKDHEMLARSMERNRELLMEIKEELAAEVTTLKLGHQKLKYMIYGLALVTIGIAGKPEIMSVLFHM